MKTPIILIISAAVFACITARGALAQRDYFTAEEIEMIRDTQQLDNRTMLLTKIIDRRFTALNNNVGGEPISPKEVEKWGTLPSSSRRDLLWDIRRILEKAIADIDNLAERPKSMVIDPDNKKPKKFDDVFPNAVRILAKAAGRYQIALKTELDKATEPAESGSILASLEMCAEIIAAQAKLPSLSKN
ncbi:MAG: hypothetical protein IPM59_07820 [Chloracidobacterium sp.]|nr:hypothetical protein [Chloracidobacterium sp.]